MPQYALKLPLHFLSLFPSPLHLIIEGATRSGKTSLAQHLAKNFATYTEIWSYFNFSQPHSAILDAPIYKPGQHLSDDELPIIWRERASFWLKDTSNKSKCILIDEAPRLLSLDPEDSLLEFLRQVENTNIILTTQGFETERGLIEHLLKPQFSLIRLGLNAKRYAEIVLEDITLLQKLEVARYPCLCQGEVVDLAEFSLIS